MSQQKHIPKEDFDKRATADMARHLAKPEWSVREKLALSCRMLAREGHGSGIAGQVTARGEQLGTMWTARFGLGLEEIQANDFLLVDENLNVLDGVGMPNPSNRFHLWIYRYRADVHSIMHTHPPYVSALSMIGVPLKAAHMDTSMFYEDCAFLEHWPGPPIGDEEGELIANALGGKRAILLAHHGQLCACTSVEEAAVMSLNFERAAHLQLMAMSAGTIRELEPQHARAAHDYRLKPEPLGATFHYFARQVLRTEPECLE